MTDRVVVAGCGNIFLGDDGFGVEVISELTHQPVPDGVQVVDIGIRGVHLAYDLLGGCRLLILVDAAPRGQAPGTVSVLEVDPPAGQQQGPDAPVRPVLDPHSMAPDDVLALLHRLGSPPVRTLIVACEPADLTPGMDLSEPVRAAVPHAVRTVQEILARETAAVT